MFKHFVRTFRKPAIFKLKVEVLMVSNRRRP